MVSGPLLRIYSDKLVAKANITLPENEKIRMTFSKGWYSRFTQRNNLR